MPTELLEILRQKLRSLSVLDIAKSGADPGFLLTGFFNASEASEWSGASQASVASKTSVARVAREASKKQLGGLGGAVSPPSGAGAEPRKIFKICCSNKPKSFILAQQKSVFKPLYFLSDLSSNRFSYPNLPNYLYQEIGVEQNQKP